MTTFLFLSVAVLLLYVYIVLKFKYSWETYPVFRPLSRNAINRMSVIIPFRNEVQNLENILAALENQDYPSSMYEVILIDDYSDDGSEILVKHFCNKRPNFRYINNVGKKPGKKSAIRTGINAASNELILTTDADCIMNSNWLTTFSEFYNEYRPDMIVGLVDMADEKGFFNTYQEIEFLSLIASGAGAAASGRPIYCNAACLAFKKSLYLQVDDPLQAGIISGDDTFFLHTAKRIRKKILLLKSPDAVVKTAGQMNWSGYFNQRFRWVSKSRYYRDRDTIYTAIVVFLVNLALVTAFLRLLTGKDFITYPILFVAKYLTDYLFLRSFRRFFLKGLLPFHFLICSLFYPFTVLIITFAGLYGKYDWKGRKSE